jgi:myo-inositol-1(or 4)-monophosphatase
MTPADRAALLALAVTTAREAGDLITAMRGRGVSVAETKSSPVDIVTEADRACEDLVRERLLGARPGDGFVGEEGDDVAGDSGVRWVVDPIDGTVNYLYGLPNHCVSIAAAVGDQVVAGVVRSPVPGLEYAATLGGGATRNGVPLSVRSAPPLAQALISTGFSYRAGLRAHQARAVARMLPQVRDLRRMGSCALDLCAVAAGESDGYVEEGTNIWDHAAAGLIAREAGATLELWPTPRGNDLLVCAPVAGWAAVADLVRTCGFAAPDAD